MSNFKILLRKLELYDTNLKNIYSNTSFLNKENIKIKTVAQVFEKEQEKQIGFYEEFSNSSNAPFINENLYKKLKDVIDSFERPSANTNYSSVKELIAYALNVNNSNIDLINNIRSLLSKEGDEESKKALQIVDDLLSIKNKHVNDMKFFIKY